MQASLTYLDLLRLMCPSSPPNLRESSACCSYLPGIRCCGMFGTSTLRDGLPTSCTNNREDAVLGALELQNAYDENDVGQSIVNWVRINQFNCLRWTPLLACPTGRIGSTSGSNRWFLALLNAAAIASIFLCL